MYRRRSGDLCSVSRSALCSSVCQHSRQLSMRMQRRLHSAVGWTHLPTDWFVDVTLQLVIENIVRSFTHSFIRIHLIRSRQNATQNTVNLNKQPRLPLPDSIHAVVSPCLTTFRLPATAVCLLLF